jgi:hypothetical protein
VPRSRRYADPETYLYTVEQWAQKQAEHCKLVGKPAKAADAIAQGKKELHTALAELEKTLAKELRRNWGSGRIRAGFSGTRRGLTDAGVGIDVVYVDRSCRWSS